MLKGLCLFTQRWIAIRKKEHKWFTLCNCTTVQLESQVQGNTEVLVKQIELSENIVLSMFPFTNTSFRRLPPAVLHAAVLKQCSTVS